ncbi:hypothetical protein MYAER_3804 [Microcystis aeruginosa NIES-2549]|uniref:Uncharacterized protein n=1 Tax=Microcystis aeruginosa NIES-2549 TaxID=1641812 RepID=A0A0F6U7A8_MICAE|nr:hypothetical protein MYAER_3804 [Microcystis aeruginosa NIES-2549]AOC54545.1 hypothetical protein amyaer_3852 [Microcystis aeruginosa NIES-2481]
MATSKPVKPYTPHPATRKNFLPQTLNILGLYSVGVSFDYGLKLGSFKGDTCINTKSGY